MRMRIGRGTTFRTTKINLVRSAIFLLESMLFCRFYFIKLCEENVNRQKPLLRVREGLSSNVIPN